MREWVDSLTTSVINRGTKAPASATGVPGRPRLLGVSSHQRQQIDSGWEYCGVAPGAAKDPIALEQLSPDWRSAIVPGTVASSERCHAGTAFDLATVPDYDARDWWFRCRVAPTSMAGEGVRSFLCFDGLASIADVWMNDQHLLTTTNMFVPYEADVSDSLQADNTIFVRFHSLKDALDARRPRPRWRTKLVEHQQLRWHRTTLLGRIPGWSPPVRPVGPWREVRLEHRAQLDVIDGDVVASLNPNGAGEVSIGLTLQMLNGCTVNAASIAVAEHQTALVVSTADNGTRISGTLTLPTVETWWPHTHGGQPQYSCHVTIDVADGVIDLDMGSLAFRRVDLSTEKDGFSLSVNGASVFCRGACWTTPDIAALRVSPNDYRDLLRLARDAGMNMIRVGGTMVYEDDAFYDACDELGILVWQDFMFANMDYPAGDAAFSANVSAEADAVLARLRRHPSLAILCGNSEVEQQAAMVGADRDAWRNEIFREILPRACERQAPGVPYWPSSPSGGVLPFHVDAGVGHYYGVGAYLRPIEDARRANVRFTSECLGFSNVPSPAVVDRLLPAGEAPSHHPKWKARVPRDHGTGWDFEDVRDHYLRVLFGVDPVQLRYADMDRYLALSRVTTGEVMSRVIGEWRRRDSTCRGALIWFYQDLWPGAGWGVVDSNGAPKAAYYALKRAMQPISLSITDEGVNGLHLHVVNDTDVAIDGELTLTLLQRGSVSVAERAVHVQLAARAADVLEADAILGSFRDPSYAYRFGPPGHDVVAAVLRNSANEVLAEAFHFPIGLTAERPQDPAISASAENVDEQTIAITLRAERFAQWVALDAGDFVPDDNYFHLLPGQERRVVARARVARRRFDGFAQALNAYDGVRIAAPRDRGITAGA